MSGSRRVHDRNILDTLEAQDAVSFDAEVWRITRAGLDPLRGSAAPGRWSPAGEFDVLYTSLTRDGALAEIGYRLSLEPVWSSRIRHELHTIRAATKRTLRFADVAGLRPFGVDASRYESFDYATTQAIVAAAHFLEFDGLIVPSPRAPVSNLVLFLDQIVDDAQLVLARSVAVNWNTWRKRRRAS